MQSTINKFPHHEQYLFRATQLKLVIAKQFTVVNCAATNLNWWPETNIVQDGGVKKFDLIVIQSFQL